MPSLVEKLAAIAETIPNLLKEGHNGVYPYLRAIDVFDAVRVKLFKAGILIVPTGVRTQRSQPYLNIGGNPTDEVIGEFDFQIIDGQTKETINCTAPGVAQDYEGKALYMASTGAKKDLIKSLFLIAGWEDDAESVQDPGRVAPDLAQRITEMEAKAGPDVREWPVGIPGAVAWNSACRTTGLRETAKKAFLKKMGVKNISDLKRKDFDLALGWALGKTEVSLGESTSSPDERTDE